MRSWAGNFPCFTDFPGLSGFGFLNVHVRILSFVCLRFLAKVLLILKCTTHFIFTQLFFISSCLPDDVIGAPDLWLAAAAARCTPEAGPRSRWAFAITWRDWMHSQGSCFLHPGLYRSLEPTGLPQAVSTVPPPCTVVQAHRWETQEDREIVLWNILPLMSDNNPLNVDQWGLRHY